MTPAPVRLQRCLDTLRGDRCERPIGHPEPHKKGEHTWGARDIPVPPWRAHLSAVDMTARVLGR